MSAVNPALTQPLIAVYGSARISANDPRYTAAEALGGALANAGFRVATGGYTGIMEAVSRGAHAVGGTVLGLTVTSWDGAPANRWVSEQIDSRDLFDRLRHFSHADLGIAVEGGVGTLVEVATAWNLLQVGPDPRPLLLVGDAWGEMVDLIARRFVVGPADLALIEVLPSAAPPSAIIAAVLRLLGTRAGSAAPSR